MDSHDLSLGRPPVAPGSAPAPAPAQDYPTHALPEAAAPKSVDLPERENPFGEQRPLRERTGPLGKRIGSVVAAGAALVAKFFAAIKGLILLLPNIKLIGTAGTALVSVAAYSLFFGWTFAAGFVLLLFIHEMGHVIQLRREGIKASAPMFIPFMGAAIFSKSLGDDALAEARVGLAGPVLGTLGAAACLAIAEAVNSDMLRALAYLGFFLNLFNLLPVVPLDGGRAMAAMAPWMWFAGFAVLLAVALAFPNPIILIIVLLAGFETWRRWQARKTRSLEQAAYYRVSPRNRMLVGAVYIGLIVILALGMHESHILSSGAHSFRSL